MNKATNKLMACIAIGVLAASPAAAAARPAPAGPTATFAPRPDAAPGGAAQSAWSDISQVPLAPRPASLPLSYRLLEARLDALDAVLNQTPLENAILELPSPNGALGRFRVEVSPVFAPALARRFPQLKTYRAYGLDDPTAVAALDRSPAGFHAMVLSADGTWFIEPYRRGDTAHYISYDKRDAAAPASAVFMDQARVSDAARPAPVAGTSSYTTGASLRTYRLAVAASYSYTLFASGGVITDAAQAVANTLVEIGRAVHRVNSIYVRDVAIQLQLVDGNDQLIHADAASDPYHMQTNSYVADNNHRIISDTLGLDAFDIGHAFTALGGGLGGLGVVCDPSEKGAGVTGSGSPTGDSFWVDFVAHEIGHQFGANHTYNGIVINDTNCSLSNYAAAVAYEPGSASTIMGYVGTCDAQNLQTASDAYFHAGNLDEFHAFIADPDKGGGCGVQAAPANHVPVIAPLASGYAIPRQTPFTLSGSATDADGDALVYSWEEMDLGSPFTSTAAGESGDAYTHGLPNTDAAYTVISDTETFSYPAGPRPVFRSYAPAAVGWRVFPRLSTILSSTMGMSNTGESLPTIDRDMAFRLTVRDGKGGVANASLTVTVAADAGPFRVAYPNTPTVSWEGGSQQVVSWEVAGTDQTPILCARVDVALSVDGGNTFSHTLAAGAANDGTVEFVVPSHPTTAARVRVSCADNVFFAISGQNFAITPGTAIYLPLIWRGS